MMDDIYLIDLPTIDSITTSYPMTASSSGSSITTAQSQQQIATPVRSKLSVVQEFLMACGEEEMMSAGTAKEKSKRIHINNELKYFKLVVQKFIHTVEPSGTLAIEFWKIYKDRLPLLSHLAKIHLMVCATSVASESAFSSSTFIARKERTRLSSQNLSYSVFLKDKV